MITVTEPQVWTLIGVFAAVMLGGMTLMTTLLMRTITTSVGGLRGEMGAEIGGLRAEMKAKFETVHEKFTSLENKFDAKFDVVEARFNTIDVKLEHLDRDVQALSHRVFNGDPK